MINYANCPKGTVITTRGPIVANIIGAFACYSGEGYDWFGSFILDGNELRVKGFSKRRQLPKCWIVNEDGVLQ